MKRCIAIAVVVFGLLSGARADLKSEYEALALAFPTNQNAGLAGFIQIVAQNPDPSHTNEWVAASLYQLAMYSPVASNRVSYADKYLAYNYTSSGQALTVAISRLTSVENVGQADIDAAKAVYAANNENGLYKLSLAVCIYQTMQKLKQEPDATKFLADAMATCARKTEAVPLLTVFEMIDLTKLDNAAQFLQTLCLAIPATEANSQILGRIKSQQNALK